MTAPIVPELDVPVRILLGPGPGMPHPRVVRALTAPTLGHLDPELLKVYAQEQELLRYVFQTKNEWTFALSGTGASGMEAALATLIEPVSSTYLKEEGIRMVDLQRSSAAPDNASAAPANAAVGAGT